LIAGLVGEDGPTSWVYDLAYLRCIPILIYSLERNRVTQYFVHRAIGP
jgi:deoxyxylulose-5-phosphate synthase